MSERDVYLGPFEAGHLAGQQDAWNKNRPAQTYPADLHKLLFASLIQAGAKRFRIPHSPPSVLTSSDYLQQRIIAPNGTLSEDLLWMRTAKFFEPFLPPKETTDEATREEAQLIRTCYFLADVALAMESGMAIVVVSGIPKTDLLHKILPPEICVPIQTLIGSIEQAKVATPIPSVNAQRSDVRVLVDLLHSDVYDAYSSAHLELGSGETVQSSALSRIGAAARGLTKRSSDVTLGESTLGVLASSPKMIEALYGKFAGEFSKLLTDPIERWLKRRSRIIIYRFDELLQTRVYRNSGEQNTANVQREAS